MTGNVMFGKLTAKDFSHGIIEAGAGVSMLLAAIAVIALLTYTKRWKYLWNEWLTSLDPKRIGVMYIVVSMVMFMKGFIEAIMMRAQQVISVGESQGFLASDHYQQIFTVHGTNMIFFVAMGIIFGMMNLIIPLQIGARDVAFPFLNAVSFYLFATGAIYVNMSLVVGSFSGAGWLAYPPLSGIQYSPDEGVDYWIWTLQIAGVGSLMSGINFLVTIFKLRAPGMTLMKMPLFVWCTIGATVLICFAFPILTGTLALLTYDRYLGSHFFTSTAGGNPMMYVNLIWAWGHPEVYILILPAFGVFSEVVATFSRKRLFGYTSMVWAIIAITFLSFIVWLHHFFTMGAGANVNAFFGIMTMVIAIPTGVKVFNWLFTCYRGKVSYKTPMLYFFGFVFTFIQGGMTGVLLSVPAVDYQVHNSLFLIAHFHSMVIPGVLFAFFAGFNYWFPKYAGFKLNEKLGNYAAWCWIIGFLLAFMPLYMLGFMGATRRLDHYDAETGWQPLFIVAACGVMIILLGIGLQFLQLFVSILQRKENQDVTGDPWNGRTLEWSTASPPPFYNFAFTPQVHDRDEFWEMKSKGIQTEKRAYQDIHMPKNSHMPLQIGVFAFLFGFALIWQIWWLGLISFIGIVVSIIIRLCDDDIDYYVPAAVVEQTEKDIAARRSAS